VDDFGGLKFSAGGQTLKWRRDLLDGWTIKVEVPTGQSEVLADSTFFRRDFGGRILGWLFRDPTTWRSSAGNQVLLFPRVGSRTTLRSQQA